MAKKIIKKTPLKKAQYGVLTEAPVKSKEIWHPSGQFYVPSRRNQIIDSTYTPQGINKAKLKEHFGTLRKMVNDRDYLARERELNQPAVPEKSTSQRNGGKTKMKAGGMIKRADGSISKRGLWDNIRANKGSGKKPTAAMLKQEKKIKAQTKKK
jgi:hypothetical protein